MELAIRGCMAQMRIGVSGWSYPKWRGAFYPQGLPRRRELEYASRQMNSIEISGSFYSLQSPSSYQEWYEQTPDDFLFSVKGPRFITHLKKLNDVQGPLANFFASGVLRLREKLGPVLWQFPPRLACEMERFEEFLKMLPHDTFEAAALAKHHNEKLKNRAYAKAHAQVRLRHALEVRHQSFCTPDFLYLLHKYDVAIVQADTAGKYPYIEDITTDFVYVRLNGSTEELDDWALRIKKWRTLGLKDARHRRDVFVYFDNDAKAHAPFNAISLAKRFNLNFAGSFAQAG